VRGDASWNLYDSEKERVWICSIQASAGVVVEAVRPCSIENDAVGLSGGKAERMVCEMYEQGRHVVGETASRIKRALRRFNMQTRDWKGAEK